MCKISIDVGKLVFQVKDTSVNNLCMFVATKSSLAILMESFCRKHILERTINHLNMA